MRQGAASGQRVTVARTMTNPSAGPDSHRLGDILCRRGLITRGEVDRLLAERDENDLAPLGARLVETGRISKADLRSALEEQRLLRSAVMEHLQQIPRLGDILRRRGLVSEEDLMEALDEQTSSWEVLGTILLRRGKLRAADLERALRDQRSLRERVVEALATVPRLGDFLCERGLITREQLHAALAHQDAVGGRLGAILVRDGVLALEDLVASLAEQKNLRNLAVAALIGAAVIGVATQSSMAGDFGDTSSESVVVSVTIPKRVEVHSAADVADYMDVGGAITMGGSAAVVPVAPFAGPVHVEAHGSGAGGALTMRGDDGQTYPYKVEFYDPQTDEHFAMGDGHVALDFASIADMPSMMQVSLADGASAPVGQAAIGTLVITVSAGI